MARKIGKYLLINIDFITDYNLIHIIIISHPRCCNSPCQNGLDLFCKKTTAFTISKLVPSST